MASPSLSSSVARITSFALLIAARSGLINLLFVGKSRKVGLKLFCTSIPLSPSLISLICPKLAIHL